MLVRVAKVDRGAASGCGQLRAGFVQRYAGCESGERLDRRTFAAAVAGDVQSERNPEALRDGECEALRHDADDGHR